MLSDFIVKYYIFLLLPAAFILDAIFGDPEWFPHPVRFIGKLISFLDKKLYSPKDSAFCAFSKGALLFFSVFFSSGIIVFVLQRLAWKINPIVGFAFDSFVACICIAPHDLCRQSANVAKELKNKNLSGARKAVSRIVGRDTENLSEEGVIRAAVETVAESTNDGIIAPAFYIFLAGPVGGMLYKAVNTMDSMIGYKNDKYLDFGACAARLDDFVNYIPARLSAVFMILSAIFLAKDFDAKNAIRIFKRDRYNHSSPNSAQTESVCAGALGLQLAGPASYFGIQFDKPYIGDAQRQIEIADIKRANKLMLATSLMCCVTCSAIMLLIVLL